MIAGVERVIVEVTVAAPVDVVWKALRDPAEIRRWHGWEYDGLEAEIDMIFIADVSVSEERRTLDTGEGVFQLEPRGAQTIVRVTRAGPARDAGWEEVYDEIDEGWLTFVQQLRFALERHPGEDRRTLFLAGRLRAENGRLPADALGIAPANVGLVGESYEATTAVGALAGEVWFRSVHQLGLTVDGFGDGLVIVTEQPALVLTTYGLDDDSFDRLRAHWAEWWSSEYEESGEAHGG